MAYDVFISYSHEDKAVADAICARLEQEGIRCWYAPRDITPGADWAASIMEAIRAVQVMVIVFTDHSNESPQVRNEISNAASAGVTIVPLRLTSTQPAPGIQYYFNAVHWLDAVDRPLKASIQELCVKVQAILQAGSAPVPPGQQSPAPVPPPAPIRRRRWPVIAAVLVLLAAAAAALLLRTPPSPPGVTNVPTEAPSAAPTEAPAAAPTATPAAAPAEAPAATPGATAAGLPTVCPANSAYAYRPEGTAVITSGSRSWTVPASSVFGAAPGGLSREFLFRMTVEGLPRLRTIRRMETEPYGDGNEYHRRVHFTLNDGSAAELDIQTSFAYVCFLAAGSTVRLEWSEIDSIVFDWDTPCLADWPEYARFHMRDGTVVIAPAFTLTVGLHDRPSENQISFSRYYSLPAVLRTARGYQVDFTELSAISFGQGAYDTEADSLHWWPEEITPGWILDLPLGIRFKDGRYLETSAAADWIKLFALDEFGAFEAAAPQIAYVDFVSDLSAPAEAPAVRDASGQAADAADPVDADKAQHAGD